MLIEKKTSTTSRFDVKKIVVIGLLSALTIVLSLTPLGFIPIPPINPTIMHIPVIIGAILEGPLVGAMLGLIFGITSFFKAIMQPTLVTFPFLNPLVSVLPRVIIGFASYYAYNLLKFKSQPLRIGIGVFIGSITNTIGVLGAIYLIYLERYAEAVGLSPSATGLAILGVVFTNGLPEAIVSVLICIPVIQMLKKMRK
ncbi:MAG: transporter component [Clostridiales bacterium]|nr:transporter component [Clostridiales bacterium]